MKCANKSGRLHDCIINQMPGLVLSLSLRYNGTTMMISEKITRTDRLSNGDMHKKGKVFIIGAGIAGVAAARMLQSCEYNVTVFEARSRIGGRIWTMHGPDTVALDLGAQWIVGTQDNPVLELAKEWQLPTIPTNWFSVALYEASGTRLSTVSQRTITRQLDKLLNAVRDLRDHERAINAPDSSLRSGINRVIAEMPLSPDERNQLDYILSTDIEHELAADLSDLSLYYWDEEGRLEGDELVLPGGYDQIITRLAYDLDIRRECIVTHITTTDEDVEIATNQGVFTAERAIVTVPLGTLQQNKIGFSPGLPARKLAAIRSLSVGVLNKVFLCFPSIFWPEEEVLGHVTDQRGEWSWFINLASITGSPVLLGLNAGQYGLRIESLTDREIVMAAMRVLRKLCGREIPQPDAYYITRWASDPFSCGSYSHIPPGGSCDDYSTLAEPFKDRLFFAGEATTCKFAGTVHGAYLSGLREAKRIMALN
jgi:monoamine oxidase